MDNDVYTVHFISEESQCLKGNLLGDPAVRTTVVISPKDIPHDRPLPTIWVLSGFTGRGLSYLNQSPWQENLFDRLSRLRRNGMPPVRVVLPDCFTKLGGSQYLDSPVTGLYATYVFDELRSQIESQFSPSSRMVMGKSSGGFGAIAAVAMYPGLFQGLACHSGDMLFEWSYFPDFPQAYQIIQGQGGVESFVQAFSERENKPGPWVSAMNVICMAAVYSPNLAAEGFPADFPLDFETLALNPSVWRKWLKWDPVRLVDQNAIQQNLRSLKVLYFDAGHEDEFQLQYGAAKLHRKLDAYHIDHVFELFEGGHFHTNWRFDRSLALLAQVL